MPAITNGAELVRKLKATGTGESKLAIARKVLQDAHDKGGTATAAEVLAALKSAEVGEGTLDKVTQLIETGVWTGPKLSVVIPIEDQLDGAAPSIAPVASGPASSPNPELVPPPVPGAAELSSSEGGVLPTLEAKPTTRPPARK